MRAARRGWAPPRPPHMPLIFFIVFFFSLSLLPLFFFMRCSLCPVHLCSSLKPCPPLFSFHQQLFHASATGLRMRLGIKLHSYCPAPLAMGCRAKPYHILSQDGEPPKLGMCIACRGIRHVLLRYRHPGWRYANGHLFAGLLWDRVPGVALHCLQQVQVPTLGLRQPSNCTCPDYPMLRPNQ